MLKFIPLSLCLSLSLPLPLSLSRSCTSAHTPTRLHTHTHTHSLSHAQSLSLSCARPHILTPVPSKSKQSSQYRRLPFLFFCLIASKALLLLFRFNSNDLISNDSVPCDRSVQKFGRLIFLKQKNNLLGRRMEEKIGSGKSSLF